MKSREVFPYPQDFSSCTCFLPQKENENKEIFKYIMKYTYRTGDIGKEMIETATCNPQQRTGRTGFNSKGDLGFRCGRKGLSPLFPISPTPCFIFGEGDL